MTGTNKAYIDRHIPHLVDLITDDLEDVIDKCDVVLISHDYEELSPLLNRIADKIVIDLVRIKERAAFRNYQGICW